MKTRRAWILMALAALLGATAMVGAQEALKARPTAVGVVDIETVLRQLVERQRIEGDLNARRERLQLERRDKEREVTKLREDLGMLNPGTEHHRKTMEDLGRKAFELQAWVGWQNQQLASEQKLHLSLLYSKILTATGALAKQQGYDLVLFREGMLDFSNPEIGEREMRAAMGNRKVLWVADEMDLTDQVVQAMNVEFDNSVPGAAAN